LIQAKLWSDQEGQGALWVDLDWDEALKRGMAYAGLPFSGNYDFVHTEMYLPVSHMVSKASEALSCEDCHTRTNSRLEHIEGIYIPGKSYNATIDTLGMMLILLSLGGVFLHAILRLVSWKKRQKIN